MYLSTKEMDKYISGKTIKCGKIRLVSMKSK